MALYRKLGGRGYPNVFFLDGDGNPVGKLGGYVPPDRFGMVLDQMLNKLPSKPQEKPAEPKPREPMPAEQPAPSAPAPRN
jgi:thioredoxin-related protein